MAFNLGYTDVVIANMALSKIGARSSISSMNENSPEAQQVRLWYNLALAQTLEAYNWSFARRRRALTQVTDTMDDQPWAFRYHFITDAIAIREIENPAGPDADAVPYATEVDDNGNNTIVTNLDDAVGIFTIYEPEVQRYSPLFIEAFSACLAWRLALPLTGDRGLADERARDFAVLIRHAAANDANQSVSSAPRDSEFIRARN